MVLVVARRFRRKCMYQTLALDAWRTRLEKQGHAIVSVQGEPLDFIVQFPPDTIITIALIADWGVYPAYRNRYFVCPEPGVVLRAANCPEPHRDRWLKLVAEQPPSYWRDFLAGPGSWTLARLLRFREVVVWSNRGVDWTGIDDPFHRAWGMQVPWEAAPYFPPLRGPESFCPHLIIVDQDRFADSWPPVSCSLMSG